MLSFEALEAPKKVAPSLRYLHLNTFFGYPVGIENFIERNLLIIIVTVVAPLR